MDDPLLSISTSNLAYRLYDQDIGKDNNNPFHTPFSDRVMPTTIVKATRLLMYVGSAGEPAVANTSPNYRNDRLPFPKWTIRCGPRSVGLVSDNDMYWAGKPYAAWPETSLH